MARVMEFYIPQSFKPVLQSSIPAKNGKVIEFRVPEKKSA